MSKFKAFFKESVKAVPEIEVQLARFPETIRIKPLSAEQQEKVLDGAKKKTVGLKGRIDEKLSEGKYMILQAAESIVYPDLDDTELQQNYDVMGREALVRKMFTADELGEIAVKLAELDETETFGDLVETAKN